MHQLQWGIHLNPTQESPRHLSLKHSAARASPHYGVAILSHHRPPEPLLSESQGPLLALMTSITMHTIKCQAALALQEQQRPELPLSHPLGLCLHTWDPCSGQDCCRYRRTSCSVLSWPLLQGTAWGGCPTRVVACPSWDGATCGTQLG